MARAPKAQQTPLDIAEYHYNAWLTAELELTTHQSYTIGTRSLTRVNLAEVRQQIIFWRNEIERLKNKQSRKGRNRVIRVVPRDL